MEGDSPLPLESAADSDSPYMESGSKEDDYSPPLESATDSGSEPPEADPLTPSESAYDTNLESEGTWRHLSY